MMKCVVLVAAVIGSLPIEAGWAAAGNSPSPQQPVALADREHLLNQYCSGCHNNTAKTGGMSVQGLHAADLSAGNDVWENILHKLSAGEMPPKGRPRPTGTEIGDFTHWLETSLDAMAAAHPNPGRATLRRLNRAEYADAVRDVLGLDIDMQAELPVDDTGYGFDNIADVLSVSPTLMNRYITAAGKIGRLATGLTSTKPSTTDYKTPKDPTQLFFGVPAYNERASDDLPLDSRGGGSFNFYAPYDATYNIRIWVNPGTATDTELVPENLYELKIPLKAGLRTIGASFQKLLERTETLEDPGALRAQLVQAAAGGGSRPRPPQGKSINLPMLLQIDGVPVKTFSVPSFGSGVTVVQAVYPRDILQISVVGPYDITGPGNTASRRKIFICRPSSALPEKDCARRIISTIATHAYRRPVTQADIAPLMKFYDDGRAGADFDHGIEAAIEAVLASPKFLFVVENDPAASLPGAVHQINDLELATRLSLFLWSSVPDDKLLSDAEKNRLHTPSVLKQQVVRMLADPRSRALTDNFAGQWLYLRNLDFQRPDKAAFPEFDQRLRASMKTETTMFVDSVIHENRSILDFLDANYTFLNQRLADHYGIAGVYGTSFRRVTLNPAEHRGGLLGQGSILTVTSYDNRTSVVRRGKWILDNLLAAPPPPPPPNVPSLTDVTKGGQKLTVREQMEIHRANPVCASCHTRMDPLGFALESYDAVGAWRTVDAGKPVDTSAVMPDGTKFDGPQGLQDILMAREDQFVEAFTQRLMIYALSRGLESYDMPTVRAIRRATAKDDFRFQSIVLGIVQSPAFELRKTPDNG